MGTDPSVITHDRNSAEAAGLIAGMAETAVTVVCHGIGGDRAVVTGRGDHLDDVGRVGLPGTQAAYQTDALADDLALAVDAAPKLGKRSGDNLLRKELLFALQLSVPGEPRYFTKYFLGDVAGGSVVCNHSFSLFCPAVPSAGLPADCDCMFPTTVSGKLQLTRLRISLLKNPSVVSGRTEYTVSSMTTQTAY